MTRRIVTGAAVALAMAASLAHAPAWGATDFDITVTPDEGKPATTFTVSGDATDPTCADDGVQVRLFYTKPDGSTATVSANTVADASGHFSAQLTVPDNAVAGAPAHVNALVADCTPPEEPTVGARSSESVPFDVLAYEGTFTLSKTTGKPGDKITFTGTNCWGGDVAVFFSDLEVEDVTLKGDKTFSGSFVVPDAPGGTYEVAAECPGTDYESRAFVLVNPDAPPAPPARPVPRRPRYTG
jgi:plastocyanin